MYWSRRSARTPAYCARKSADSATHSSDVTRLQPKYSRKRRKLYMQRERRYRSKLLYLVACASWPPREAPQAECMHVVWGPWKLRALRGMGITGMGGPAAPRARIRTEGRAGGSCGDGRAESSVLLPFAPRALALLGCCCL